MSFFTSDNLKQKHYVHQKNYYNTVKTEVAETLFNKKTKICCVTRASRGLPPDLLGARI
jgi:hypothetical protein